MITVLVMPKDGNLLCKRDDPNANTARFTRFLSMHHARLMMYQFRNCLLSVSWSKGEKEATVTVIDASTETVDHPDKQFETFKLEI